MAAYPLSAAQQHGAPQLTSSSPNAGAPKSSKIGMPATDPASEECADPLILSLFLFCLLLT